MVDDTDQDTPEHRFGRAVRQVREERVWSQETLAVKLAEAGINVGGQSGVARIERGARPTRLNEVVQISNFLLIDTPEILGYIDRLDTEEEIGAAKEHLFEVMDAEDDARAQLHKLEVEVLVYQRIVATLERKHTQVFRSLELAGADLEAVYRERLERIWKAEEADGDR